MESFRCPFNSNVTEESVFFFCLFVEMECILLRFPMYVIGSSLAEIVKIENTRISN